jgi:tetratricopeptide (TPR) repeat protein
VDVSQRWLRFLYKSDSAFRLALLVYIEALQLLCSADSNRRSTYKSYRDALLALGKDNADLETLCRMWAFLGIITLTSGDTLRYDIEEQTLVGEELLRLTATDMYPQPELAVSLALSYQQLFLYTGEERYHKKAIELLRRFIGSASPLQTRMAAMSALGTALADFGFSCKKTELLREAYDLHEQVLSYTQKTCTGSDGSDIDPVYQELMHPHAITQRIALEQSAWTMQRMWDLGCLDETKIDEVILLYEEAIRLGKSELGNGPARRLRSASLVYHLTVAVHRKYRVQDDILSLDDAIRCASMTSLNLNMPH